MFSRTDKNMNPRFAALSRRANRRAYSARLIRWLAGLAGLCVVALFLFQSGGFDILKPAKTVGIEFQPSKEITGVLTTLNGFDKDGLPYAISAQRASQDAEDNRIVHMVEPAGAISRSADGKIELSAKSARYNTQSKQLYLEGDVVFEQKGSYVAKMDKADLKLDDLTLSSRSKVRVEMVSGMVEADHLEVSEGGTKTLFSGHVKAKFKSDIESGIVP